MHSAVAVPVEHEFGHSNPSPVLTDRLAPTFTEDGADMSAEHNPDSPPPVLTDQAPSNSYGLAYIPDTYADMCMQPIEDPLASSYNPWNIEWSDKDVL